MRKNKRKIKTKRKVISLAVSPNAPDVLSQFGLSTLRAGFLLWVGALTASITLFGSLQVFLDVADWARYIAVHWNGGIELFWSYTLSMPKSAGVPMTFITSLALIAAGISWQYEPAARNIIRKQKEKFSFFSFFAKEENLLKYMQGFCVIFTSMAIFRYVMEKHFIGVEPHFTINNTPM